MRTAMHFTRLGSARKDARFSSANPTELAIGQLLGLAASAGFRFDVIDGRLVTTSPKPDWRLWPTLRACLDEIGVDTILKYFETTTPEKRTALSAPAH